MPLNKLSKMFRVSSIFSLSLSQSFPVLRCCAHLKLKLNQYAPWLKLTHFEMRNHSPAPAMKLDHEWAFWMYVNLFSSTTFTDCKWKSKPTLHTSYDDWLKSNIDTHVHRLPIRRGSACRLFIRLPCAFKRQSFQVNERRRSERAVNVLPAT